MIKDRSTFRLFIILIILITFSLVRMTYFDWLLSPRKFLLNSWRWLNLLDASNMPWIQWYTATNIQLQPPFPGGGAQELLFLTRANSTKWSRWGIGLGDTYTITFWGIFELVVKESGGERSDGKKEKASLPARALLSFPSSPALLACSVVSTKPWESLWKKQLRGVPWSQRTFPNMRLGLNQKNVSQAMLPAPERELRDPARAAAKETRSNRNVNDKTNPVQTFSGFVTKPVNHH